MPAVAGLKKQGANNGACLAFLISTPETGVDSIAVTYSLLDPIMTVIRPVTAFVTAFLGGVVENLSTRFSKEPSDIAIDRPCHTGSCCDGKDRNPEDHAQHHTFLWKCISGGRTFLKKGPSPGPPSPKTSGIPLGCRALSELADNQAAHRSFWGERLVGQKYFRNSSWRFSPWFFLEKMGLAVRFAFHDLMHDLALWFLLGIVLAGIITVLVPDSMIEGFLGSGLMAYLAMLVVSLPMYVCATMSTPIAAALVLKGMSPGAALILLVAGPATNAATVAMVGGLLGRRTLVIYLGSIVICTLIMAGITDLIYQVGGISAKATAGTAARELVPYWLEWAASLLLAVLVGRVLVEKILIQMSKRSTRNRQAVDSTAGAQCGCRGASPGGS